MPSTEQEREDAVLTRLLNTPPTPHKPSKGNEKKKTGKSS